MLCNTGALIVLDDLAVAKISWVFVDRLLEPRPLLEIANICMPVFTIIQVFFQSVVWVKSKAQWPKMLLSKTKCKNACCTLWKAWSACFPISLSSQTSVPDWVLTVQGSLIGLTLSGPLLKLQQPKNIVFLLYHRVDWDLLHQMFQTNAGTNAEKIEPWNFQGDFWQPEEGGSILTDMWGRLKIPLEPIKIQREACTACPQPKNLFLSALSR